MVRVNLVVVVLLLERHWRHHRILRSRLRLEALLQRCKRHRIHSGKGKWIGLLLLSWVARHVALKMRLETTINLGLNRGVEIRGSVLLRVIPLLLKHMLLAAGEGTILHYRFIETFLDATIDFGSDSRVRTGSAPELGTVVDLTRCLHRRPGRSVIAFREKTLEFHVNAQVSHVVTVTHSKGRVLVLIPRGPGRPTNTGRVGYARRRWVDNRWGHHTRTHHFAQLAGRGGGIQRTFGLFRDLTCLGVTLALWKVARRGPHCLGQIQAATLKVLVAKRTSFLPMVTIVLCKAPSVQLSDKRRVLGGLEVYREDFLGERSRLEDIKSQSRRRPSDNVGIFLAGENLHELS